MAGLFDMIEHALYEEVIGRKETHLEEFTLLNAWKFLIDAAMDDHRAAMSVIKAVRKGERYEIQQVILNKNMDPIMKSGELVVGRTMYAYMLDDDIVEYIGEKGYAVMKLDTLKLH